MAISSQCKKDTVAAQYGHEGRWGENLLDEYHSIIEGNSRLGFCGDSTTMNGQLHLRDKGSCGRYVHVV